MTNRNLLTASLLLMLFAGTAAAELQLDTRLTMADIENHRKTMVMATVEPSPQQEKDFWHIYDAYREEMGKLEHKVAALIEEYVDSYAALTDQQAERFLKALNA